MSTQGEQASTVPNVSLSDLIGWIESRHNRFAVRFERGTFNAITNKGDDATVTKIRRIHSCSWDTARCIYSMSFGEFQIMGFNLYGSLEYNETFTRYLGDPGAQRSTFNAFVLHKGIAYSPADLLIKVNRDRMARFYNGSLEYVKQIDAALKRYGIK